MSEIDRRRFLDDTRKATLGLAGGVTILANPETVRATPANDRLVLAMIGVGGGRGNSLAMGFLDRGDCEIRYVCDVNRQVLPGRVEAYAARQGGKRPKWTQDFREMLGDTSIDAVVIATPPHWHALATILCCRAGKDEMYGRFPDPDHKEDFVSSVRSRKRPNADIEGGHRSMLLVHYANISCRLGGRKLQIDPKTEQIIEDAEAMEFFRREYRKPWVVEEVV